jgi:hypothetical protein
LKTLCICCLSLHWAFSNCCDPWKNSFHSFMITIHVHTIYPLAMLLWEVSIVTFIISHKIKAPRYVSVSLYLLLQKRHGLSIKKYMDTWRSKHSKKKLDTWRS